MLLLLLALATKAIALDMDMDMDEDRVEFHPVDAALKSFHWILTVAILLILPSITLVLAFANRLHFLLILHFISTGYCVFESLFLRFPDPDNHENRTSTGTSWFLSALLGATVFVGSFINGSNLVMNRFYPNKNPQEGGFHYKLYKFLSVLVVLTGWVRVCIAPIALFGFCYGKHTGQCIAHGIMGLAFVGYSAVLLWVLLMPWIRKRHLQNNQLDGPNQTPGYSQEFFDSTLMCVWGIVNTFTEHRWGTEDWSMGDYQHTAMGIIWWAGGLVGMFLSRGGRRSFIPALLLIFTGYLMSQHAQHMVISTKVHGVFGLALMGAGFTRILEISLFLQDKGCSDLGKILSFQYFPPFCLTLLGILFMGATEEQLQLVHDLGSDHLAYILVALLGAFMVFLWLVLLMQGYLWLVGYTEDGRTENLYDRVNQFELGDMEAEDEE